MGLELLLGTLAGAICGAIAVGTVVLGVVWWQNQQRINSLRANLGQPAPATSPLAPTPYMQQSVPPPPPPLVGAQSALPYQEDSAQVVDIKAEYPTMSESAGVKPGSAWIDGVGGIVKGQRMIIVKTETLLGRSGVCDLQFHDPKVSRQHAMLKIHNEAYFIQDMQSSRGTYVNGRRVDTHQLQDRDQVQMGDTILVFRRYD